MGGSPGRWPPRRGYLLHYRAVSCQPSQCSNGASSTFRVITGAETCAGGGRDRRQCREDQGAAAPREAQLANWVGESLVPMDCLGCLASRDVPVPGQLSLVKQGVGLGKGTQDRRCCGGPGSGKVHGQHRGSRGVTPGQSAAETLGAVMLAVVETHLKASESGLENGCGCSPPPATGGHCSVTVNIHVVTLPRI